MDLPHIGFGNDLHQASPCPIEIDLRNLTKGVECRFGCVLLNFSGIVSAHMGKWDTCSSCICLIRTKTSSLESLSSPPLAIGAGDAAKHRLFSETKD